MYHSPTTRRIEATSTGLVYGAYNLAADCSDVFGHDGWCSLFRALEPSQRLRRRFNSFGWCQSGVSQCYPLRIH
nr:MAG TPA: hypothetical protein [Caudoviricetes sp.]